MSDSYKNGFEFVIKSYKIKETPVRLMLERRNGCKCYCPYGDDTPCGSHCPLFVIENCSIVDKKCSVLLTCGKHSSRYVEIID